MTDTPSIPPALTKEEWERRYVWRDKHMADANGGMNIRWNAGGGNPGRHFQELGADERHAFAALCLYEQPFGFEQADVPLMRRVAEIIEWYHGQYAPAAGTEDDPARVLSVLAKIAALLPPEADAQSS